MPCPSKTEMRQESHQILPFTIFFSLFGEVITASKTNGGEHAIWTFKSSFTSRRLGSDFILKANEMQQGLKAAVLHKH